MTETLKLVALALGAGVTGGLASVVGMSIYMKRLDDRLIGSIQNTMEILEGGPDNDEDPVDRTVVVIADQRDDLGWCPDAPPSEEWM